MTAFCFKQTVLMDRVALEQGLRLAKQVVNVRNRGSGQAAPSPLER